MITIYFSEKILLNDLKLRYFQSTLKFSHKKNFGMMEEKEY